jgi:hypothetical protein
LDEQRRFKTVELGNWRAATLLFACVALANGSCTPAGPEEGFLALTGVSVVDVRSGAIARDQTVLIRGSRIASIGRVDEMSLPDAAQVVGGAGLYLLPGLWDMHTHVSMAPLIPAEDPWFVENLQLNARVILPLLVANGVTGIRDMGGDLDRLRQWHEDVTTSQLLGPRIVATGCMLEGPNPRWPCSTGVLDDDEARAAVARLAADGADFVKIQGGLSRNAYFAIVRESNRLGIPFAGHVPRSITPLEAAIAGQRSIEHFTRSWMSWLVRDGPLGEEPWDTKGFLSDFNPERARALGSRLMENDIWLCPTLVLDQSLYFPATVDTADDARLQYIPAYWQNNSWKPWVRDNLARLTTDDLQELGMLFERQLEIVRILRDAGVRFLVGSDAGGPYVFPGFSVHEELQLLVRAGLTPLEAIQAATLNPARFLELEDSLGSLDEGKFADMVLLAANPLEDIANIRRIEGVVLSGRYLSRQALDEILNSVRAAARSAQER